MRIFSKVSSMPWRSLGRLFPLKGAGIASALLRLRVFAKGFTIAAQCLRTRGLQVFAKGFTIAAICLVLAAGCAGLRPKEEALPHKEPGVAAAVDTFRAAGVVVLKKGFAVAGRATILVKRPSSFRIEVSGPFGQTVALLLSDGDSFYIYSGGEAKTFRWDDPALPYPLRPAELVSVLTGSIVQTTGQEARVTKDDAGRVIKLENAVLDAVPFIITLQDYRDTGGMQIPFDIRIMRGVEEIDIRYSTIEINPVLPSDAFLIDAVAAGQ